MVKILQGHPECTPVCPPSGRVHCLQRLLHHRWNFPHSPQASLPTISDWRSTKNNFPSKRIMKLMKLFVFEKRYYYYHLFSRNIAPGHRTEKSTENPDAIPRKMGDWCSCASSVSPSLAFMTTSGLNITHWIPEHSAGTVNQHPLRGR